MILFNLRQLCESSVSKYSHILPHRGLGPQHVNLRGGTQSGPQPQGSLRRADAGRRSRRRKMSKVSEAGYVWRQGGPGQGCPAPNPAPLLSPAEVGISSASDKERGRLLQPWHLSEESLNK